MKARDLVADYDDLLTDMDYSYADNQLSSGVSENIVKRRLYDWIACYRLEQQGDNATIDKLHGDQ